MKIFRPSVPLMIALLMTVSGYGQSTYAAPSQPSSSTSAHPLLLTDGLLDRMIAVARESRAVEQAKAGEDNNEDEDETDDDDTTVPSIASIAAALDANPAMHAILVRHGFTGKSYLLATTTLAQAGGQARMAGTKWASKMQGADTVDPRNVSFYTQHKSQISALIALNNPDYSVQEDEQMTRDLRSLDPEDFDDCLILASSVLSVTPVFVPGSTATTPAQRIESANATSGLAEHFHSERLKKDFGTMADEIRRHAGLPRMESPIFNAAMDDATSWGQSHCKGSSK